MKYFGFVLVIAVALSADSAAAYERFGTGGGGCSERHIRFDGERAHVEEEVIDAGNIRSLRAAVKNAPVSVTGGNASGYTITVCKAAAAPEDLRAIHVSFDGGELRASGPEHRRWSVSYAIRTPADADVDIEATNGPLSFRNVEGRVVARGANGPLSLKNVSGNIEATTTNGPISVTGGSGTMKVRATNGPLTVRLAGAAWAGGGLDASTKNGPLSVSVPRSYGSGVVVESLGRGPLVCRAEACETAVGSFRVNRNGRWNDEPRTIELGRGAAAVRLATVNGPVTIKDAD